MNLLIITSIIGKSPAGQVFENLIDGLLKIGHNVKVVCNKNNSDLLDDSNIICINSKYQINITIKKILIVLFKDDFSKLIWQRRAIKAIKVLKKSYKIDFIIAFGTGFSFNTLRLGYKLSKMFNIKFAIHTVDPMPSKPEWGNKTFFRNSMIKTLQKYFSVADIISASNNEMLNYQLEIMNISGKTNAIVLPNPITGEFREFTRKNKNNIFLYLGTFGGKRTPDNLLYAFNAYIEDGYFGKLYLIGDDRLNLDNFKLNIKTINSIKVYDWTDDIDLFIAESKILIDIDADIENDVFISSKLIKYLNCNRFILSISNPTSPTTKLLKDLNNTIYKCPHNINQIKAGFVLLSEKDENPKLFNERVNLINEMRLDNIINKYTAILKNSDNNSLYDRI